MMTFEEKYKLWSWLQGYSAGIESAEEKIKKVFEEAEEEEEEK